jgi:hypothetical protein
VPRSERRGAYLPGDGYARPTRDSRGERACFDPQTIGDGAQRRVDAANLADLILDKRNQSHLSDVRQALGFVMPAETRTGQGGSADNTSSACDLTGR